MPFMFNPCRPCCQETPPPLGVYTHIGGYFDNLSVLEIVVNDLRAELNSIGDFSLDGYELINFDKFGPPPTLSELNQCKLIISNHLATPGPLVADLPDPSHWSVLFDYLSAGGRIFMPLTYFDTEEEKDYAQSFIDTLITPINWIFIVNYNAVSLDVVRNSDTSPFLEDISSAVITDTYCQIGGAANVLFHEPHVFPDPNIAVGLHYPGGAFESETYGEFFVVCKIGYSTGLPDEIGSLFFRNMVIAE